MKIDYLTITLKPGTTGWNKDDCIHRLQEVLMIDEWQPFFHYLRSDRYYEEVYEYSNCYLKVPSDDKLLKQGVCIEMTGQGVDYYQAFLCTVKNSDLRTALNRFRGACRMGAVTRCSRIDIAIDDKCFGDQQPKLDIDVIADTLRSRAFVSKFRRSEPAHKSEELQSVFVVEPKQIDEKLPFAEIESMNMSTGRIGKTLYLGKRSSGSYIRIYDKLAEQEVHGCEIEKDLTAWTRFEVEFHRKNAGAVFAAFCDSDTDEQFGTFFARVVYDLIRFVDMDRSRRYNATVCAWWLDFLGTFGDRKLEIHKLSRNRYVRTQNYFNKSMAAALFALVSCEPENLFKILSVGQHKASRTKNQIISDYKALQNLPPGKAMDVLQDSSREETGLEYWRSYSIDPDFDKTLYEIYLRVFNKDINKPVS